jgi:uncharacterized damage-inducible protein DinB
VLSTIHDLFRHMAWADAKVWRTALTTPGAEEDRLLREKLWHVHMVQRAFLAIWRGSEPAFEELSSFPDLRALAAWGRGYHDDVAPFLTTIEASALDRPLRLPWAARITAMLCVEPADPTLQETLFQVAMHSLYHRGQVNMRMRELGAEPPLVDYIAWIWIGRPAPEW